MVGWRLAISMSCFVFRMLGWLEAGERREGPALEWEEGTNIGRAGLLTLVEGLFEGADLLAWVDGFAAGGGGIEEGALDEGGGLIDGEPCLLAEVGGLIDRETCLVAAFSVGCLLAAGLRLFDVAEVALTSPSMTVLCMLPSRLSAVAAGFLEGAALPGLELEGWSSPEPAMF